MILFARYIFWSPKLIVSFVNSVILHPFLFVLINLLLAFEHVWVAILPLSNFFLLSLIILSATLIFNYLAHYIVKDRIKAGIITSLCLTPILNYKYLVEAIYSLTNIAIRLRYAIVPLILIWSICIYYLFKSRRSFYRTNLFLNCMAIVFLLSVIPDIVNYIGIRQINQSGVSIATNADVRLIKSGEKKVPAEFPDIYYIITDAHTSCKSLKRFWRYDESGFIQHLSEKGFYVATESRSNYGSTTPSMATSLNMDDLLKKLFGQIKSKFIYACTHNLIKENVVVKLLGSDGYKIINLSPFDLGSNKAFYPKMFWPDSYSVWMNYLEKTIFLPILRYLRVLHTGGDIKVFNGRIISLLNEIPGQFRVRPIFVYAHLLMPHPPYFFDANGKETQWESTNFDTRKYLQYLIFTDKILTHIIDNIISKSRIPPIIILQGDHGSRILPGKNNDIERFTILNAYFLPHGGNQLLYKSISPINTFRIIFNKYFGANLPLIHDGRNQTSNDGDYVETE